MSGMTVYTSPDPTYKPDPSLKKPLDSHGTTPFIPSKDDVVGACIHNQPIRDACHAGADIIQNTRSLPCTLMELSSEVEKPESEFSLASSDCIELHPLLEPGARRIKLDLSESEFLPLLIEDEKGKTISIDHLFDLAVVPPAKKLAISSLCNEHSPLNDHAATYGPGTSSMILPYVRLGDLLYTIHKTMQTQVSHEEWAKLNEEEKVAVARAYWSRCERITDEGKKIGISQEGVKRVDYLLDDVMFAGLAKEDGDTGYENLKLFVNRPDGS